MKILRPLYTLLNEGSFEETWEKIVQFIYELLNPEMGQYENLGLDSVDLERIRLLVIALFAALIVSSVFATLNKSVYGKFVDAVNGAGAWSPESAKTLAELGCERNGAIRSALRRGRTFAGIVRCVEQDAYEAEYERKRREFMTEAAAKGEKNAKFNEPGFVFDFDYTKFYIPEDKAFEAEARFERKGSSVLLLLLIIPAALILMIVALHYMPDVIQLLDNFIGSLGE